MKKVLITGKNSYIGTSVQEWLQKDKNEYLIDTIDLKDNSWKSKDFSKYDVVFHVAGIAHVSADPKLEKMYHKVNTELTIETATKCKSEGVKQFIFMSSMIVYGNPRNGVISRETKPNPENFYGTSKLNAERGIISLISDSFNVVIIRPPMIYGKGSKGNYSKLSKLARITPIFPYYPNKRSMLFIDNLCEFVKLMIDNEENGTFFPQNSEYVNTSDLVNEIAKCNGNSIFLIRVFNPIISILRFKMIKKMFGTLVYDQEISKYKTNYIVKSFKESIRSTEI